MTEGDSQDSGNSTALGGVDLHRVDAHSLVALCVAGDDHPMKPKLTLEEHAEMGRALASMRDELISRHVQLANAYPRSGQPAVPAKKLDVAIRALDAARAELENALYQEHPETAQTTVYYPHREDRVRGQ